MNCGIGLFFVSCVLASFGAQAGRNPEIRAACARVRQAVAPMRRLGLPNVFNPITWHRFLDSFLDDACSYGSSLEDTVSEFGPICTLDSDLMKTARFYLNKTEAVCTDAAREEARTLGTYECFTDQDKRYHLDGLVNECIHEYFVSSRLSAYGSMAASCLVFQNLIGCLETATSEECGPDVAKFVSPLVNLDENPKCYLYL